MDDQVQVKDIERALVSLDRLLLRGIVQGLAAKHDTSEILENYLTPALEAIGEGWYQGSFSLSQVYMSGKICEELIDELLPKAKGSKSTPKIAVAVLNDFHPLGKKMVAAHLRAAGYIVKDYGAGREAADLVDSVRADSIEVLLISTLMLPSALNVRHVRAGLDELGLKTKIIVGGAPFLFDSELWKEVGADLMGHHASEATSLVKQLEGSL